jgi:hypothetical protein
MYEYNKNPSNQSGGSITKVTVEETFDEAGRLISRTTTTEYEKPKASYPFTTTINTSGMISSSDVDEALKNIRR